MKRMRSGRLLVRLAALLLALVLAPTVGAGQKGDEALPERFRAFAANLSNVPTGADRKVITIEITRWSTDGERERLLTTLKERGETALLDELRKLPRVGYFRTPDSLAYDLRFAQQRPAGDGGRQITLVTDRYIAFWELTSQSRTLEYPFTLIELRLDHNGEGEGKLSVAAKITIEADLLVLENYATQPVRLLSVTKEK